MDSTPSKPPEVSNARHQVPDFSAAALETTPYESIKDEKFSASLSYNNTPNNTLI